MINMVKFVYQICGMPEPKKQVPVNPKLKQLKEQQNKQINLTEGYQKGGNK